MIFHHWCYSSIGSICCLFRTTNVDQVGSRDGLISCNKMSSTSFQKLFILKANIHLQHIGTFRFLHVFLSPISKPTICDEIQLCLNWVRVSLFRPRRTLTRTKQVRCSSTISKTATSNAFTWPKTVESPLNFIVSMTRATATTMLSTYVWKQ